MSAPPPCRFCGAPLTVTFADLGETPLANNYVTAEEIARGMDVRYPLHARVCGSCLLVQAESAVPADAIFSHYPYFSSYSDSWVEHARRYAMEMTRRFHLGEGSLVVEVASNDGYLLQHFKALGVQVLGVEPAANVAAVAQAKGVATEVGFFGVEKARDMVRRGIVANLMAANNVLAHVPDIREFVGGFEILLGPEGVVTFEFPHVLNLINQVQFATIYHEHYSKLSLVVVERVLATAKMRVFDVDELPTHGGSLRIYACHEASSHQATERVDLLRLQEAEAHLAALEGYITLAPRIEKVKSSFSAFLSRAKAQGKTVAAYGAAAKGTTFLNVCGLTAADISHVFDRAASKQGLFLPGSHIPILPPERLSEIRPDYLVILPWNLTREITASMSEIHDWGGRFVVAVPETHILPP